MAKQTLERKKSVMTDLQKRVKELEHQYKEVAKLRDLENQVCACFTSSGGKHYGLISELTIAAALEKSHGLGSYPKPRGRGDRNADKDQEFSNRNRSLRPSA